jgi:uncharacterized protein (DUF111 family)
MTLPRRAGAVKTPYGEITGIIATLPDGGERFSPEYAACVKVAQDQGVPLDAVQLAARRAYEDGVS